MNTPRRWRRSAAVVLAAGLVIAACGSDDNSGSDTTSAATESTDAAESTEAPATTEATTEATTADTDSGSGEALATEGSVEIAAGTTLELGDCPDDWSATQGVDGDEIRIGQTLPQSGQLAAFGAIGEGIQYYFDYVNDNDPIDGKNLVLIQADDGYEAGRAVANVEEMLDTEDIFAFAHFIGTPINAATRPITQEACVPQLFNSSGFPLWGDPANWPWTTGNILDYSTETKIWCTAIADEFGDGATVAALVMNNDFGKTYQTTLEQCEADGQITLADVQVHDPAAADITNEMTTLTATGADVFVAATTGAFCPQSVGTVAASDWRPRFYMSYTCGNLASYFEPVKDATALLSAEGSAPRLTNSLKVCGDPQYADDPAIQQVEEILAQYGDVSCADGSYSTGVLYGEILVDIIRSAAALPGGLNRVNLMAAMWNADTSNPNLLGGTLTMDGVNDAYWTEAAQIQEVTVTDGALGYLGIGDVIDMEGEGGSYQG